MKIELEILQFLHFHPLSNRAEISMGISDAPSDSTMKRLIASAVKKGQVEVVGKGPSVRYKLTPQALVTMPLDLSTYFNKDIDEREAQESFNFELIQDLLPHVELFTTEELDILENAQKQFLFNIAEMTALEYRKEMERLGVDLSWKSSQIEDIHAILTKELGVDRNIRHRRVGITGTNYRPLDNEFQIREALEDTCTLVNSKRNVFEKALLVLVLLSYIQAFTDGNKRTARITSKITSRLSSKFS